MLRKLGLFVLVACSMTGVASAQVAMLTQVTGDVKVAGGDGSRSAVPFLKVNDGDTLTLVGGARVQMVYLSSGRQEIWNGAGPVKVGTAQSTSSMTPQASQVPALILRQLEKTPAVGQHGKTGMVMLRSLDDLGAADQLEKDYKDYRAKAAPEDTTPEVFYLTGLLDIGDTQTAGRVLEDLKAKQASQPAYAAVVEHFSRLVAEATKK